MDGCDWKALLTAQAECVLAGTPVCDAALRTPERVRAFIEGFTDERGHRRAVDRFVLAWIMGAPAESAEASASPEVALWACLARREPVPAWALAGAGAVAPQLHGGAIEVWSQVELASLHALWNAGESERASSLARWLIQNVQPDNATQHPWAVHVFVLLAQRGDDSLLAQEADMYAQQLVHNAIVSSGKPDRFSACLLWDAACRLALHE